MRTCVAWLSVLVLGACAAPLPGGATGGPTTEPTPTPTPTPSPTDPYFFAALGDWGTGLAPSSDVARTMCSWRVRHGFDIVVTAGDNIYPDGSRANFRPNFYRPFRCLLSSGVRFKSTLGNHDVVTRNGRPELRQDRFGFRGRNYVMRKGGVRFVMANSNSLDRDWLDHALQARPGDRWTIVVFHHPVYSPGEHGSTPGFGDLPRMFARNGVDLVINGHDHLYSVTRPLRRIRYVVTGGGGASPYACDRKWFTARCRTRYHFLYVRAGQDELRARAVDTNGRVFHRFSTAGR
ncbi:MAG: metallophosphoesterase family protein [Actinomycetota bacterium]